jgi:tetratricopeptide (TPR) repeat protein
LAAVGAAMLTIAPVGWSGGHLSRSCARADDKSEAQRLLTEGNAAAGDGDYLVALERFQAAYQKFKSPKILLNIGTMLRQLGRNVEAVAVYEAYQRDPGADPARARDLQRILREIDAILGRIRVQVSRPDASVRLDGRELPAFVSDTVLRVEPGEHTLVANHPGFPPAMVIVQVPAREERLVVLRVVPAAERTVVVERVFTGPQRTIGVVLGAVGLAGLAAGGAAGAVAAVKNHAAAAYCRGNISCDAEGVSLGATARKSATASTVALSAGGGLLATGIILYLSAPRRRPTDAAPASRLAAAVSGDGAALRWEGVF